MLPAPLQSGVAQIVSQRDPLLREVLDADVRPELRVAALEVVEETADGLAARHRARVVAGTLVAQRRFVQPRAREVVVFQDPGGDVVLEVHAGLEGSSDVVGRAEVANVGLVTRVDAQLQRGMRSSVVRELAEDERRAEEHTSELQSLAYLVCRLLLEKKRRHCTRV